MFVFAIIEGGHRQCREQHQMMLQLRELQDQQGDYQEHKFDGNNRFEALRRRFLAQDQQMNKMREELDDLCHLFKEISEVLDVILRGLHLLQESLPSPPKYEPFEDEDVHERI